MKKKNDPMMMYAILALAALLIWRHFGSTKVDDPNQNFDANGEGQDPDEDKRPEPSDVQTIVKEGSNGPTVKKCQERINSIIHIVRKDLDQIKKSKVSKETKEYAERISKEKALKVDGAFGKKTLHMVYTLTGKSQTNLYTLRKKYSYWKEVIKSGDKEVVQFPYVLW